MLPERVHTFGQWLKQRHGERVHKIALDAGFTCPNRDGRLGTGGCTFCNNASFNATAAERRPRTANDRRGIPLAEQIALGQHVIARGTRARKYLAYFQAYTNTYASHAELKARYDEALGMEGVIGLAVGTRPDCVADEVLDLLASYRDRGYEVWLELGLQSAFDTTLARVNRGHGLKEYERTCLAAQRRGLPVCTHLIVGLPGEAAWHARQSLDIVLDIGTDGLKLHPLHVVRHTLLARQWREGHYTALSQADYVGIAADLIERTPWEVTYQRITGTAPAELLLAPYWCVAKWPVINAIEAELKRRGTRQGSHVSSARPFRRN